MRETTQYVAQSTPKSLRLGCRRVSCRDGDNPPQVATSPVPLVRIEAARVVSGAAIAIGLVSSFVVDTG